MFLKLKEFGGILFRSEESVSLSIVRVGPYLVAMVCIPPFIDYTFRVYLIFWFLYFDLFQVKVQLVSKCYWWITLFFVVWIAGWINWYEIGFDCNVLKIVFVIFGSKICTHRPSLSFLLMR